MPKDLQAGLGKTEIKQSLQTGNHERARSLARKLTADWDRCFAELRRPTGS